MDPGSDSDTNNNDNSKPVDKLLTPEQLIGLALNRGIPSLKIQNRQPKPKTQKAPLLAITVRPPPPQPPPPQQPQQQPPQPPPPQPPQQQPQPPPQPPPPQQPPQPPSKRSFPSSVCSVKKPKVKKSSVSSSDGDDDESDDDDDESDDSDENATSSEADDESDDNDDDDVGKMRKRTPNAAKNSAFVVSASANAALKRFVASTKRIDGDTAPLGSHRFLTQAKQTLNECKSLHDLLDGSHSISEENVNEILLRVCTAADSLASASLAVQNVDVEIEAFRRLSQTLYNVWEATMPQMELLDDAILKASHGVANASRIASELFTSQLTLARTVSSSLEGIMQRSSCENGSDTSLTSFTSWATRQSPRESE